MVTKYLLFYQHSPKISHLIIKWVYNNKRAYLRVCNIYQIIQVAKKRINVKPNHLDNTFNQLNT